MLNAPLLSKTKLNLPSGALGVWDFSKLVSASRIVPNEIKIGSPRSQNITRAPRGFFSGTFGIFGGNNALTVTDNNTTAPDGSSEATTVTGGSGSDWFIQQQSDKSGVNTITSGPTFTMAISVKSLSGSSLNFKMGPLSAETVKTATTSWQRFTVTTTIGNQGALMFRTPDGVIAANFAICDWEVFAGSADLNPAPLTAKPQILLNRDIQVGFDSGTSVSGGKMVNGSSAILQLENPLDVTNYTMLYVAKHNAAYSAGAQYEPILAGVEGATGGWNNFAAGPIVQSNVGQRIAGNSVDKRFSGQSGSAAANGTAELFGLSGAGPFVAAHRFNGTRATTVINGVQILDWVGSSLSPNAVKDFTIGCLANSFFTTYDIYFVALYNRVLTDAEIRSAQLAIGQRVTLGATSSQRVILFLGSSITSALGSAVADGYVDQIGQHLVPLSLGANWGFAGNGLVNLLAQEELIEEAFAGSPLQEQIISFEVGANDLATGVNVTTLLSTYSALCDRQRARGRKVVVHTAMFRTDGNMGSTERGTFNTAVRTWVGVHCDAIADWAANATMGTDTSPNNATNFQDLVHPTIAGYAILEPITRAAINGV